MWYAYYDPRNTSDAVRTWHEGMHTQRRLSVIRRVKASWMQGSAGERSERSITAYRYEYDRPSICEGLRYRLQSPHLRECAVRGTRFSSVTAGNLAEGDIVEEWDDDHGRQDHVDDVADRRDRDDAVFGGKGADALSSAARVLYEFSALGLALGLVIAFSGRFVDAVLVVVVACVDRDSVEFLMGSHTGTAPPALRVC